MILESISRTGMEIEPILSREQLHYRNNEVTHDALLTTSLGRHVEDHHQEGRRQRARERPLNQMGVERRPISAYIQVVKVDLLPSDKCYQFNNAYTRHHKNIVHQEEVVSGTRSLWSVIYELFPYDYNYHDDTASCVEILLFHNNDEQPHQLWQEGQRERMLLDNAPYLLRDNWQWTPELFGLTDDDRIEIRIAPSDDMNRGADYDTHEDDYASYLEREKQRERERESEPDNESGRRLWTRTQDEPPDNESGRRRTHNNRRTQPRASLYNVLSQLETINISSKLGASGDPPPSRDSQERERHLEELLERERRRYAELLRQNRMLEVQLQEIRKSNRSCLIGDTKE